MKQAKVAVDEIKYIGIPEAVSIAAELGVFISRQTAISWIRKNNLGHQPGGTTFSPVGNKWTHWIVDKRRWIDFLMGTRLG